MLESVTLFLTDRVIAVSAGRNDSGSLASAGSCRRLRDKFAHRLADRVAGVPQHQDEEINSATDHVSKVQVEPDGVFYNSVAGVARQCVGRR
jgi:hypothetical protein